MTDDLPDVPFLPLTDLQQFIEEDGTRRDFYGLTGNQIERVWIRHSRRVP